MFSPNMKPFKLKRPKGAAAVEFAVIAPVILIFAFGMVEASWLLMASHATAGAAREAARAAAITSATDAEVRQTAEEYMRSSHFSDSQLAVSITREEASIAGMENITCTVAIDYTAVSILGNPLGLSVGDVSGSASMLQEQ